MKMNKTYQNNIKNISNVPITINIPKKLLERVDEASKKEYRSRNSFVLNSISDRLNENKN